jgi:hypothetical protein
MPTRSSTGTWSNAPTYAAGLKGYVTNISADTFNGERVVAAYHDLYQVERSFRMAKSDLAARPIFHRLRDSIEAHLTIVFNRARSLP